jgi:hypothetical protein
MCGGFHNDGERHFVAGIAPAVVGSAAVLNHKTHGGCAASARSQVKTEPTGAVDDRPFSK